MHARWAMLAVAGILVQVGPVPSSKLSPASFVMSLISLHDKSMGTDPEHADNMSAWDTDRKRKWRRGYECQANS